LYILHSLLNSFPTRRSSDLSFDGTSRLQNEKNLMKYLENSEQDRYQPIFIETITKDLIYAEKIMLGLRRIKGVCWEEISADLSRSEEHTSELQSRFDLVCRL